MSSPIAVCISDIHFNINNLEIASIALRAAITKAEELQAPLVIAGDLQDTKAIIRAEVANRLIEIIRDANINIYILVGNHDLLNEKSSENALNYLAPYADIVKVPTLISFSRRPCFLIPYQTDISWLEKTLLSIPASQIIMHQGFLGAAMGDYIQDKSSISPDVVKDFTVISGHYHKHQTIGTVTYIGSPFTHTFGEANDGPKGFLILNSDGTFTREILKLRKHIKISAKASNGHLDFHGQEPIGLKSEDLLWLQVHGPKSELIKLDKKWIGERILGHSNFKLDLIPTDSSVVQLETENLSSSDILDKLIDDSGETDNQKVYLKGLWRDLV